MAQGTPTQGHRVAKRSYLWLKALLKKIQVYSKSVTFCVKHIYAVDEMIHHRTQIFFQFIFFLMFFKISGLERV